MATPPRREVNSAALDRFFDTLYRVRPVDATFIGVHRHDHQLPDWSPGGHERSVSEWQRVSDALGGSQPDHGQTRKTHQSSPRHPDDWARIDIALARAHCDLQLAELGSTHFTCGNPSLAIGEVAFGIIGLITRDFLSAEQRASWAMLRLRQVPAFLAGSLATLRETRIPTGWREKALEESRGTARLLNEGLPVWCRAMQFSADRSTALIAEAQHALGGVQAFAQALEQLPGSDVVAAPCGEEFLTLCMTRGHWIDRLPDDVQEEATEHLTEARARLDEMVRSAGTREFGEIQQRLATRHPSPERYYDAFGAVRDACEELSSEHRLVTWPAAPIRYVPIPEWTRMAAPSLYYLFYRSPAPLEWPAIHDYGVTPIEGLERVALEKHLRAWNDSTIKLNHVVHHGALGHHVQNWYAARSPSRIGRIAATDCASRIAMLQGGTMAEGWACYATDLMDEVGFLTPDERIVEQHTRVRMLARAINDVEFHTGRRSFDEVVHSYRSDVGMSADAAHAEAVKNSMFPGTAMMYWLGTQGVHDLRGEMARRLGASFDLRAFHDTFLSSGAIPVALNAQLMLDGEAA